MECAFLLSLWPLFVLKMDVLGLSSIDASLFAGVEAGHNMPWPFPNILGCLKISGDAQTPPASIFLPRRKQNDGFAP